MIYLLPSRFGSPLTDSTAFPGLKTRVFSFPAPLFGLRLGLRSLLIDQTLLLLPANCFPTLDHIVDSLVVFLGKAFLLVGSEPRRERVSGPLVDEVADKLVFNGTALLNLLAEGLQRARGELDQATLGVRVVNVHLHTVLQVSKSIHAFANFVNFDLNLKKALFKGFIVGRGVLKFLNVGCHFVLELCYLFLDALHGLAFEFVHVF